MHLQASCFRLARSTSAEDVLEGLRPLFRLEDDEPAVCTRRYLESFDWRLYDAGTVLFLETCGARSWLRWERREARTSVHALATSAVPQTPEDLPPGPFRSELAKTLKLRALLPLVAVRFDRQTVRLLNDDAKTVARLQIETDLQAEASDEEPRPMEGATVRVLPVRGYEKPFRNLLDRLAEQPGIAAAAAPLLDRVLETIGRTPGDTVSKLDVDLDPGMRSDEAVKFVLRALLHTMMLNEPGVRRDLDTEFLHDYRVALRRTRSVLGQFKGVFPEQEAGRFREELRRLFRATGLTRDLHVYLLGFEEYQSWLPPATRADLEPLRAFLEARQQEAVAELVRTLDTPWYADLMDDWHAFVHAPVPDRPATPDAAVPILELAARRTWHAYRKVLERGHAILDRKEPPAEELHRLRIKCKKLRYLMELFQSLYPPRDIDRLIRELKRLQDNLGAIQDYRVQQEKLHQFALDMQDAGTANTRTFLAMGRLEGHLERLENDTRDAFAKAFKKFARPKNQRRFADLFQP